ncbi:arginine--tRNA ligase [Abditibacterium utsteinense]|uniref:arginine--tRNA ligase domain-containing protein n=1 Tax=Abditibacterium utsteinense TaxID=1960156 RepID=UPI0013008D84|nr:arginine--tRNA ligase [Abditibacterium utsteinense]
MNALPTRRAFRLLLAAIARREFETEISPVFTRAREGFGEWTSNAPLQIAPFCGHDVASIGHTLISQIAPHFAGRIEYQNGRLNFFMSDDFLRSTLELAAREGAHFGAGDALAGQRILVEFVSADPTGPLPFLAGRHAALGESVCRLLENQGARVTREFYLNDATASSKIRSLGEGVAHWYLEAFGRGQNPGANLVSDVFVRGVAAELARRDGAKWLNSSPEERASVGAAAALESAISAQKTTLERIGVRFDNWVSESSLRREGRVETALQKLQERGFTYEKEGALWLQTSHFGDETDRVLRRSNGELSYFAGDIAYHIMKGERGYERIINVWGAEHEPYIARTKAALQAAGSDVSRFEFLVCAGATLKRDGATLRLGSGGGPLLLEEELDEIESDALKFHFLSVPRARTADIDLGIARRDDESNPAYAARLFPSRLAQLERQAQGQIGTKNVSNFASDAAPEAVWSPGERELARLVALWSDEAGEAAAHLAPERVARFVLEMSEATRSLLLQGAPDVMPGAPLAQKMELLRASKSAAMVALRLLGIEARDRF